MNRLVEDLLDSARIDSGKLQVSRQVVALDALLRDVAESLAPIASGRSQSLAVDGTDREVLVLGDSARLTRVVENLVTNASKFSPDDSRIVLRLRAAEGIAGVEVIDLGRGILPAQIERLFQMDVQTSGDDHAKGGLGLGLPLARQIVELHGGKISAASAGLGKGTTTAFTVPLLGKPMRHSPHRLARPGAAVYSAPADPARERIAARQAFDRQSFINQ